MVQTHSEDHLMSFYLTKHGGIDKVDAILSLSGDVLWSWQPM